MEIMFDIDLQFHTILWKKNSGQNLFLVSQVSTVLF